LESSAVPRFGAGISIGEDGANAPSVNGNDEEEVEEDVMLEEEEGDELMEVRTSTWNLSSLLGENEGSLDALETTYR